MSMYNKIEFGDSVKRIRQAKALSIKKLSLQSGLAINTIRSIERGKSTTSFDTLNLLSKHLNTDLGIVIINCKPEIYQKLTLIHMELDCSLEKRDYSSLRELKERTKELILYIESEKLDFVAYANQLHFYIEGMILSKLDKELDLSLIACNRALRFTIENWSIENFTDYKYTKYELEILNSIGVICLQQDRTQIGLDVLLHIYSYIDNVYDLSAILYHRICYNISSTYFHLGEYLQSKTYAVKSIQINEDNRSRINLWQAYLRKGLAEYRLNDINHKSSLLFSKTLFEISNPDAKYNPVQKICTSEAIDITR